MNYLKGLMKGKESGNRSMMKLKPPPVVSHCHHAEPIALVSRPTR
jgi:hypothetical protein